MVFLSVVTRDVACKVSRWFENLERGVTLRFAHVSDLHLAVHPDANVPGSRHAGAVAEAVARDLIAIAECLDLVVVSGDLTDRAEPEAFEAFESLFSKIGLPVVLVPGNHDGPEGMRRYASSSELFAEWDITNRTVDFGDVRFLGLDTCIEGETEGALSDMALDRLEQEVARSTHRQLIVVMHHPPLVLGLEQFDSFCRLEGRQRFLDILNAADRRMTVLSGHVHRPYHACEGNIACFVAGSMATPQDSEYPFGNRPIRPTTLQDFYYIHDVGTGGHHVVTPQRVRGLLEAALTG